MNLLPLFSFYVEREKKVKSSLYFCLFAFVRGSRTHESDWFCRQLHPLKSVANPGPDRGFHSSRVNGRVRRDSRFSGHPWPRGEGREARILCLELVRTVTGIPEVNRGCLMGRCGLKAWKSTHLNGLWDGDVVRPTPLGVCDDCMMAGVDESSRLIIQVVWVNPDTGLDSSVHCQQTSISFNNCLLYVLWKDLGNGR